VLSGVQPDRKKSLARVRVAAAPLTFIIFTSDVRLLRPSEVIPPPYPVWRYAMYLPSGLGMGLYSLSVASIDSLELCALAPNAKIKIPTSSERNALARLK
jgi:hypothetical protein